MSNLASKWDEFCDFLRSDSVHFGSRLTVSKEVSVNTVNQRRDEWAVNKSGTSQVTGLQHLQVSAGQCDVRAAVSSDHWTSTPGPQSGTSGLVANWVRLVPNGTKSGTF